MYAMHIHPAVNYVILSYVIALSMTSLAQVLSGGSLTRTFWPFIVIRSPTPIAYV